MDGVLRAAAPTGSTSVHVVEKEEAWPAWPLSSEAARETVLAIEMYM